MDVTARAVGVSLGRAPGRNLAVLGTSTQMAQSVLDAAALSLARQYQPGRARFSVAFLDPEHRSGVGSVLRSALPADTGWYTSETLLDLLTEEIAQLEVPERVPHFILLYAVDAAARQLAVRNPQGTGHDLLRKLLHLGPERHTHVLGWWRAMARMRDDLGGIGARFDAIGAWVALDIHGSELSAISPSGILPWYPRPWRALFFDRGLHRNGEVMIPYRETP